MELQGNSRGMEIDLDRQTVVEDAEYDGKRPKSVRDERGVDTDVPCRDRWPGGQLGKEETSEVVEGDPDRTKVVGGAVYDGKRPEIVKNERDVDTNALRRGNGPGGHLVEEVEPGDVDGEWERQSDGDGDEMDGIRQGMDDATSGASGESRRLDTRPLAETDSSQHERRERGTAHVPRLSTPPPDHHRRPMDHPNPPRRRGRMKTRSRQVSRTRARKPTHHFERSRRSHIGRLRSDGYTP